MVIVHDGFWNVEWSLKCELANFGDGFWHVFTKHVYCDVVNPAMNIQCWQAISGDIHGDLWLRDYQEFGGYSGRKKSCTSWWFIPLFIGFQPSSWWCRISSIHSMMGCEPNKMVIAYGSLPGFAGWWCVFEPPTKSNPPWLGNLLVPAVPHKAVAEVSKIGNL